MKGYNSVKMDANNRLLLDLLKRQGNERCVDCTLLDPEWASYNLGLFLCETCAGIHRAMGSHISKIKSLKLDNWERDQVQFMEAEGNQRAKSKYELHVPLCYRKPTPDDPQVMKEQWIRAKYERHEFSDVELQNAYLCGYKEGHLWKRGKDDRRFNRRKFVLEEKTNELKYYVKEENGRPKAVMRIDDLNAVLVPSKIGNPNGIQFTFEQDGGTRNLFAYAETGQDLIEWYTAIRSAKLRRLQIAYPGAQDRQLCQQLTRDFIKEGWLCKTGPNKGDAFRRRWFTLDKRKLMYYEDPMDAFPRGEICIGPEDKGYRVVDGLPIEMKDPGCTLTLKTPRRDFHFSAEVDSDKREWMDVLKRVIRTPLAPQESLSMFR